MSEVNEATPVAEATIELSEGNHVVEGAHMEAAPVEAPVVEAPKPPVVQLTDAEKLAVRNLENEFLKATIENTRLQSEMARQQSIAQSVQRQWPQVLQRIATAHNVDVKFYQFDAVSLEYKRIG